MTTGKQTLAPLTLVTLTLATYDRLPEEVAQTGESLPPGESAGLAVTTEALPA